MYDFFSYRSFRTFKHILKLCLTFSKSSTFIKFLLWILNGSIIFQHLLTTFTIFGKSEVILVLVIHQHFIHLECYGMTSLAVKMSFRMFMFRIQNLIYAFSNLSKDFRWDSWISIGRLSITFTKFIFVLILTHCV